MKKVLGVFLGFGLLFSSAGVALAYPTSYQFTYTDDTLGFGATSNIPVLPLPNNGAFFFTDGSASSTPTFVGLDVASGLVINSGNLSLVQVPDTRIWDLNANDTVLNVIASLTASTTSLKSTTNSLQSQINSISAATGSFQWFFGSTTLTTPYIASSTPGLMSVTMLNQLNALVAASTTSTQIQSDWNQSSTSAKDFIKNKPTIPSISTTTPSVNSSNRSLNTCFQISANKDALVSYSIDIGSTLSLSGGSVGTVALTTFTNSSCNMGTTTVSKAQSGLTGTLVVGVTINNPATATVGGVVTRGLWAELVTTNTTGTPTFTMNTTQEVTGSLVQ